MHSHNMAMLVSEKHELITAGNRSSALAFFFWAYTEQKYLKEFRDRVRS